MSRALPQRCSCLACFSLRFRQTDFGPSRQGVGVIWDVPESGKQRPPAWVAEPVLTVGEAAQRHVGADGVRRQREEPGHDRLFQHRHRGIVLAPTEPGHPLRLPGLGVPGEPLEGLLDAAGLATAPASLGSH